MENKAIEKTITNYQFIYSINQKIIYEYLLSIGLKENALNITEVNLISYLVCLANSRTGTYKMFENEKYFYVMNSFLKSNLIFFKMGSRQIGNLIEKLVKLKIINRIIINTNERYIKVNDYLLNGWYISNIKNRTASEIIKSYNNNLWEKIELDFGKCEGFDRWIGYFDYDKDRKNPESVHDMAKKLYSYCKAAQHKERFNK